VLKDEKNLQGRVKWNDFKSFFSYNRFGVYGIALIFLFQIIVQLSSLAVSFYLGYALT
jgi:hypothetical protein